MNVAMAKPWENPFWVAVSFVIVAEDFQGGVRQGNVPVFCSFAEVDGSGQVPSVPLGTLSDIHQHDGFAGVEPGRYGGGISLFHALAGIVNEMDESGAVLGRHGNVG